MESLSWNDVISFMREFARLFGIPLAVIAAAIILRPMFSRSQDRAGPGLPPNAAAGATVSADEPEILHVRSGEECDLMARRCEDIEKLRLFLETEQTRQLIVYYREGILQARISFWYSIGAACLGFAFIVVGMVSLFVGATTTSVQASIAAGTVVLAVAVLFFLQSNWARRLMTEFFDKLRAERQFNEALRLCAAVEDTRVRTQLEVRLSLFFAGIRDDKLHTAGFPQAAARTRPVPLYLRWRR